MLKNRSVPADVVLPHITYQSVGDALPWLTKAFGFTEHYRYGEPEGRVEGAQVHLDEAWIMLNSPRPGRGSPAQLGYQTQSLTIFVDDVDAHFERAKSRAPRSWRNCTRPFTANASMEPKTSKAITGSFHGTHGT
jgi:uncharacterized glyoxalase superfamily protein PhnB